MSNTLHKTLLLVGILVIVYLAALERHDATPPAVAPDIQTTAMATLQSETHDADTAHASGQAAETPDSPAPDSTSPAVVTNHLESQPSASIAPLLIGVHAAHIQSLSSFEDMTHTTADIVAAHIHWGNESAFPTQYSRDIFSRNATLMIFWNPMDYRSGPTEQSKFHYRHILAGEWDGYIESFATQIRDYGGEVILAPLEEVNGDWTFWSGHMARYGSVDEYRDVFRYLHAFFNDMPNVRFAWVVNSTSVPDVATNALRTYYPGDDVVDIVGINAFNFANPWRSFDSLVGNAVQELAVLDKPLLITSTASAEGPLKAEWIERMFASAYFSTGLLTGLIWFNEDKERNWLVWSDKQSLSAFIRGSRSVRSTVQ